MELYCISLSAIHLVELEVLEKGQHNSLALRLSADGCPELTLVLDQSRKRF